PGMSMDLPADDSLTAFITLA
ncbi:hypothetical protein EVA_21699, partial [gut metagenome]